MFEYLSAVELEKFGKTVLSVCHNFFGEGYDYAIDTKNVEKYLCACGAFGNENENKGVTVARRELEEGKNIRPLWRNSGFSFRLIKSLKKLIISNLSTEDLGLFYMLGFIE